ncbi:diaminohydroxyphosphoribosylamino-pyrimidine deaminase [Fusarium tjaetaba]|uniref:Diaminohydroxyphosphoribosylamino-pyrimidine deaminase n=1 Tax=Fusarium tjaetaba TaxID=1567544 RepID=A0A8H5RY82_9HYPO|nr:diaminohydroxyphosphoribosylamino-pyrimidine deaminase [Fusarium tjaetaba]KAF5640356.1 diaminohydroxyphosphoribosylamino-pyrimidine deaminase [Fusarium tjaetaba]
MDFIDSLLANLEPEVEDAEEETFMLYSQPIPSMNLGFVDSRATSVDVSVADRDYTIHQSPTVLSSSRAGGTTGAVLWKIAPSFASWLSSSSNPILTSTIHSNASILELGCGISPLSALALGPRVARYVLTDQSYVQRLVQRNLDENLSSALSSGSSTPTSGRGRKKRIGRGHGHGGAAQPNIRFTTLDWETDEVTPSLTGSDEAHSFDAVVACDCVYNYALVDPFVQACADACRLRLSDEAFANGEEKRPCVCVIGQQLRSDEVFESWLKAFSTSFHVWRVSDSVLPAELQSSAGFVVHIGILRDEITKRD